MPKLVIIIPALNESLILKDNVLKVLEFCKNNLTMDWQIVIVDNGSTDQTSEIGKTLAKDYNKIKYLFIKKAGKGFAIKSGWQKEAADFYLFMDADLATDLSAIPLSLQALTGGADLAIGSRFHQDSQVYRSLLRKIFSWGYHYILQVILKTKISDAPCGFKAVNQEVKDQVLPLVQNEKWFFDSELVILAERKGFEVAEIPVIWQEPRTRVNKSKVKVLNLSLAYLKEVWKLNKRLKKYD